MFGIERERNVEAARSPVKPNVSRDLDERVPMQQVEAPSELRVSTDRRTLKLRRDGAPEQVYSAEFLRVHSPSAEVQGHGPDERKTIGGKRNVSIANLVPVGHYAIRIVFDDGHDSGLFTWSYLDELAREHDALWARYLSEVDEKGLSREA